MKKLIQILSVFLLSFMALTMVSAQKSIPSVDLKNLDGQIVNTNSFIQNGKITVVSFWATWCTPCKRELEIYHEIYEDWVEKYGLEIVAITIDNSRQLPKIKPLVAQQGWEFTILSDVNQDLMKQLNFTFIPQTYILDKEGKVVFDHSGFAPGDEYEMEKILDELMK
ncbi:MAG TPA: TlpA family protein disulfide reductase [Saprospirales bacterium]|nr:TlpA family protein disulfide reductase [Saprospirales bacterium]HRQ28601.1 TlpA disulfide reductase family protein [Saprospiraceae bacterium]